MDKTDIVIWTGRDESGLSLSLNEIDGVRAKVPENNESIERHILDSDILITSSAFWTDSFSRALYESERIKWVQLTNAGYDNVLKAGVPDKVLVSTIGAIGAGAVADHALGLLYAILRRIPETIRKEREDGSGFDFISRNTTTLAGKTIAVLGYGNIGKIIAQKLKCLGAEIKLIARRGRYDDEMKMEIVPSKNLNAVIRETDGLIICCPLTEETEKLINKDVLISIKRDYYLVNVSRGGIVDTEAVVEALQNNSLKGVALDVTEPEPLPITHPLRRYGNVVISPHVAWSGEGVKYKNEMEELIVSNVQRYMENKEIENLVHGSYEYSV